MQNQSNFLDDLAKNWKKADDQYFLDCEYSNDYVEIKISDTKKHAWSIDKHSLSESKNLVTIFENHYRNSNHSGFVPYFNMVDEMFKGKSFAPSELHLGSVIVFDDVDLTDVLSGIEGNFGNSGWVISKRLIEILNQYNIGQFQTYSLEVKHRNKSYNTYVYLHFHNYADAYVDYSKSKFYSQKGSYFNTESRHLISVSSLKEIEDFRDLQNKDLSTSDWANFTSIHPKEIILTANDLDLFKFDDLTTIDFFMSNRLATKINNENITGFDLKKTTKVKKFKS